MICPACAKLNLLADDDGYVDGPREYHAECWLAIKKKYSYATDSDMGEIEAASFEEAKVAFDAMFTPEVIDDGAFGWLDDEDGERFYTKGESQ